VSEETNTENSKLSIRLPLIIAVAVVVGIFIGSRMLEPSIDSQNLSSNLSKFKEVLTSIDKNYVDEVESKELVEDAIREMLKKLDPHSRYIPSSEVDLLKSQLIGHYDGIGIQFVVLQDTVYVVKALEGGPSKVLGITTGDKIITVEGENITGINIKSSEVADRLLGPSSTEVSISILRGNEMIDFTIKRGKIPQKSVQTSYMVSAEIGYIKIANFGDKTYIEFKAALDRLKMEGMEKLILDLQGNPGGRMDAAERISDELIGGNRLIVSQKSSHKKYNSSSYAKKEGVFEEGPIVVLVDEKSASASEIVSGALQDHDRALIVGRRTFGKGLVQLPVTLNDNSELMLTIARYYTPSGRSIQKPYTDMDSYFTELSTRYDHGEYFHEDSIKFDDSLRYTTANGRVVYGGGGIMPDHFVPYDTMNYTNYYRDLISSGVLRKFSIDYFVTNRDGLSTMELQAFLNEFTINNVMLKQITDIGEEFGVTKNLSEYEKSLELIKGYAKADIAEFLWNEEGYYRVVNPLSNEVYIQALELFDEATLLAKAYN